MLGDASADAVTYSAYTCYTGICDFVPVDIDTVGYRVFLGNRQYFVSSDVGGGKMQCGTASTTSRPTAPTRPGGARPGSCPSLGRGANRSPTS